MNEKHYGISAVEGNDLREDVMQIEERDQSEESEECDQSMKIPRRLNDGTGVDRLEISFDGKS